jgi:carbon-monoxide dehydrogenase medium subunit
VSATVNLEVENGKCRSAGLVLGGVADVPLRASEAEEVLKGESLSLEAFEETGRQAAQEIDPASDVQGSAEYRRDLAAVLVKRALLEAAESVE